MPVHPIARMATVLLVLNDVRAARRTGSLLRSVGHVVFTQHDGRGALGVMEQEEIDVVACDAMLTGMLGTELIIAARILFGFPKLPGILLSQLPGPLLHELFDAEPLQLLVPPFSGKELLATLRHLGF